MYQYELMNAHMLTVIILTGSMLFTPLYLFVTYVYSGASRQTGLTLAGLWLVFGAFMTWACLAQLPASLGPLGALIVPFCWIMPSLLLWLNRDTILRHPLSQHWLTGLQIFRVIGGVFLIEMIRQNIPGIFAYPAGIGDILVGVVALAVILIYGRRETLPRWSIMLVLVLGVLDFISAFFFGFFSSENPAQLFFPDVKNNLIMYPTGLIPLFLVPYAIFFHTLSWLSLRQSKA